MVKRVILGRSGEEKIVDLIRAIDDKATAANTRPAGVKVLEWDEDMIWSRSDGTVHSVRDIDEELEGAQGRIEDAEQSLADSQVRLDEAEQTIASTAEDLTRVETVVIPAAEARLAEADAAAQQELATLDGKLATAQQDLVAVGENIGQLETDLATESDAREQLAQDMQGTFTELDTRLGAFATDEALAPIRQALTNAQAAVEAAQGVAETANQAANAASQAALEAAGIAASKGRVIIQETEPVGEDRNAANIWIKPIPDDPATEIEEKAITYVYLEGSNEWVPTSSDELAQAAQNALDAREAAQQAKQRADTAISNAAAAQSAAEAAQRTADDATLDAREAHNEAVEARERADTLWGSGDNLMAWGAPVSPLVGSASSSLNWGYVHDPGAGPDGSDSYIETTVSASQAGYTFRDQVGDTPVQKGRTYLLEWQLWTDAPTDNLAVGYFPVWRKADGTSHNTDWSSGFRPSSREAADPIGSRSALSADPFVSGEWRRIRELVPVPDVPESEGGPIVAWSPRLHRWNEGSTSYGGDGSSVAGEHWRVADIRLRDVTDALEVERVAQAAQARADEAMTEAASKLDESQVQAIADEAERLAKVAASADATAKAEQAEADAAVEAARVAQEKADAAETNAALTAQEKADAAKDAAEAWAKAEDEKLEARAAQDASAKADQALADAKAALATARGEITNEIATSVNGKNSITRSTSNASGSGVVAGDAWYKVDSSGDTMAMWIWSGSAWVASKVRNEMIDTIDVNKLKVHDSLEVVGEAVINKLWADGIAAKAIETSSITVAASNAYPDPDLSDSSGWNSNRYSSTGGRNGGGSVLIESGTAQRGSYFRLSGSPRGVPVKPGKYKFGSWMRPSETYTGRGPTLYARLYRDDGTYSFAPVGGTNYFGDGRADTWQYEEWDLEVPDDGYTRLVIGYYINTPYAGAARFSNPVLRPMVGAVQIEDGAIGADKVRADEVGAAVGKFVEAEVGNLKATQGTIGEAVIDKIWADGIVGKTATFNRFVVAATNLAPRMTSQASDSWDLSGTATWVDSSYSSTGQAIRFKPVSGTGISSSAGWVNGPIFPVQPGTKYQVTAKVGRVGTLANGGRYYIGLRGVTETGSIVSYGPYAVSTESAAANWDTVVGGEVTIPDNVNFARVYMLLEGVAGTASSSAHTTIYDLTVKEKVGAVLIEDGAITTPKLTVTGDMSAAIVNAMTTNTKKLVVTKEAILNHATLIGQTVVDDINVQGKLIGTGGVFTGTVDFANINVTGEVLAENLTGAMIRGAEISTSLSGAAPFLHLGNSSGWPSIVMDDGVRDVPATLTVGRDSNGWGPHTYGGVFIEAGYDATDENHASFGVANGRSHLSTFDPNTTQQTALWMYPERVTLEYMDGDSSATGMYIVSDETYTDRASIEMRVGGGGGRVSADPASALITARGGHAYSSSVQVGALTDSSGGLGIALTSSEDIFMTGKHPTTGNPYFVAGSEIADYVKGSGWVTLSLGSGWNPRSAGGYYSGVRVRRNGNSLEINGAVQSGSSGSLIATIPSALRPTYDTFVITTLAGGGTGQAFVGKNGTIMHSYGQNSPGFLAFNVSIPLN